MVLVPSFYNSFLLSLFPHHLFICLYSYFSPLDLFVIYLHYFLSSFLRFSFPLLIFIILYITLFNLFLSFYVITLSVFPSFYRVVLHQNVFERASNYSAGWKFNSLVFQVSPIKGVCILSLIYGHIMTLRLLQHVLTEPQVTI